jgi:hypothetical protein
MGWFFYPQEEQLDQPETLPLVPMMQQLLTDIQQIDHGIYIENFVLIEEGAGNIADHPTMTPQDKKLVKETLGTEMQQFVDYDMIVHHHADSMKIAALQENMEDILRHYRIVQQGCVDCHAAFRTDIIEARAN